MTQATAHRYVVIDDQVLGGEPIIWVRARLSGPSWNYRDRDWPPRPSRAGSLM